MADEIEGNRAMFVGQPAWHLKGTVVREAPNVEQGIIMAGADWRVNTVPIFVESPSEDKAITRVPRYFATQRDTDGKVLGIVGPRYTPLQNIDAFRFFNPLLHEGDCSLESAGVLKGGTRVWVLARINGVSADVVRGDQMDAYILLCNGHDGTFAVLITYTAVRVVWSV